MTLFFSEAPIIAIDVLAPKQALSEITDKVNAVYFSAGVQSVWIIVPLLQTVFIRTPNRGKWIFTDGIIEDPVTSITIPFSKIFRTLTT